MTQNETSAEDVMDAGYAALALDPEYQATQEARRKLRGLNRYRGDKLPNEDQNGNVIAGMWSVSLTSGEQWEQSRTSQLAVFPTLEEAQCFYDAYSAALDEADKNEVNQYEYAHCDISFIPFYQGKPAFHILYEVETTRDAENLNIREVESVRSIIYSEERIQSILEAGTDPYTAAVWNDRSLAVFASYGNDKIDGVVSSAAFPELLLPTDYDPKDETEYDSSYETFITFDPKNVVLENKG